MNTNLSALPLKKLALALALGLSMSPLMIAQAQDAEAQDQTTESKAAEKEIAELDITTVTARKREETIVEVPMNITAVSAQDLSDRNITEVNEIYRTLAGGATATGQLILRGLAGGNSPSPGTTSQFVDGIPFGFNEVFDVQHVEVLRGPQGTLWGSNAIGGTVQIITNKPHTDYLEIFSSVRLGSEKDVDGMSNRLQAGINVPVVDDTLALRVVGSVSETPGQIVNAKTGRQAKSNSEFLRAQLQWEVNDNMRVNTAYTNLARSGLGTSRADRARPGGVRVASLSPNADSAWGYDVGFSQVPCDASWERPQCFTGGNPQVDSIPRYTIYESMDGWSKSRTDLVSVNGEVDDIGGFASLTYVGSWRSNERNSLDNWSRYDMADMLNTWIINDSASQRVTHELRLQSMDNDSGLQWTAGLFHDHSWSGHNPNAQWQYFDATPENIAVFSAWNSWAWGNPGWANQGIGNVGQLGQVLYGDPNKIYNYTVNSSQSKEFAAFGELSYELDTDIGQWEATVGLRHFELEDALSYQLTGLWIGPSPTNSTLGGEEKGNRKKFSLSWMPSETLNIYGLYSEGYRPGGNNGPLPNACAQDAYASQHTTRYSSDSINNYELGMKGAFLDRRLNIASAIYYIDWSDVRTSIYMPSCGFSFTANAANARSQGFEFESSMYLNDTMTLTFNTSYTDSKLLSDVPALGASKGDDMTMVPKYNGYLAVDKQFELLGRPTFGRVDVAFYGPYKSHFNVRPEDESPGYQTINLSGRMELSDRATFSVFLENVLDRNYTTYQSARSRTSSSQPLHQIYGAGRTFTVRYDYHFE